MRVKNIIFDLGGVLIPISYERCLNAFRKIGASDFEFSVDAIHKNPVFINFETGKITDEEFRKILRNDFLFKCSDIEIDTAWNKMILPFQKKLIERLSELKSKYNLYLLSNTNEIHERFFSDNFKIVSNGLDLNRIFVKTYYSHRLKDRKPNTSIFETVITDSGIEPDETVFFEDTIENLEVAKRSGIKPVLVQNQNDIYSLIEEFIR